MDAPSHGGGRCVFRRRRCSSDVLCLAPCAGTGARRSGCEPAKRRGSLHRRAAQDSAAMVGWVGKPPMDGGLGAVDLENCHFGDSRSDSPDEPCGAL